MNKEPIHIQDKMRRIWVIVIFLCFPFLLGPHSSLCQETLPVLVIERDVPQVLNHAAMVNHTTYVVNLSDTLLQLTLRLVIPSGIYKESQFYPRFGKNAQLDFPMHSPFQVEIREFHVLDKPLIEKEVGRVSYIWKDVALPPHEAAIIYFDNYLGEVRIFHTSEGLDLSGLIITTNYQASLNNNEAEISLAYQVKNTTNEEIKLLQFELFFPDTIMSVGKSGENLQLLDVTQYCLASGVQIQPWIIRDGFGNMAQGNSISVQWETLHPGEEHHFFASFTGRKKREKGEIYPLFIVNGRMDGTRLLEPTIVESEKDINVGRFYYTHYATTVPDSKIFKLKPETIEVVPAEKIPEPTFATLLPEEVLSGPIPPPTEMPMEGEEVPQTIPP